MYFGATGLPTVRDHRCAARRDRSRRRHRPRPRRPRRQDGRRRATGRPRDHRRPHDRRRATRSTARTARTCSSAARPATHRRRARGRPRLRRPGAAHPRQSERPALPDSSPVRSTRRPPRTARRTPCSTGVQQLYRDPGGHTPDWAVLEIVDLYQTASGRPTRAGAATTSRAARPTT